MKIDTGSDKGPMQVEFKGRGLYGKFVPTEHFDEQLKWFELQWESWHDWFLGSLKAEVPLLGGYLVDA